MPLLKLAEKQRAKEFVNQYCDTLESKKYSKEIVEQAAIAAVIKLALTDKEFAKALRSRLDKKYPARGFKNRIEFSTE